MKRRIFSMLLAVLMMFTTVDISAFAKQAEVATEFDIVEDETGTEVETEINETETEAETTSAEETVSGTEIIPTEEETSSTEEIENDIEVQTLEVPSVNNTEEGTVTRIEWLKALVEAFSMSVDEDNYPDNYYSDIDSSYEYYYEVMLATEFGLVDVEAGDAFEPDAVATREFAAYSMNLCMGYLPDEGAEYTFNEADSVTYPNEIQMAIDKGWFALEDGYFLPEQGVKTSEKDAMIAIAIASLSDAEITENYNNQYSVKEGVILLPETVIPLMTGDNELTLYECTTEIKEGDIFIAFSAGIPIAYKAVSVAVTDEAVVVTTGDVKMEEAFGSLDLQGNVEADMSQVEVVNEDAEITYVVGGSEEKNFEDGTEYKSREAVGDKKVSAVFVELEMDIPEDIRKEYALSDGVKAETKCTISDVEGDTKYEPGDGAYLGVSGTVTFTSNVSIDVLEALGINKKLVEVPIAGIGRFKVTLDAALKGEASINLVEKFSVGVNASISDGIRLVHSFKKKSFTINVNVEGKLGVKISAGVDAGFIEGELYAKIGAKASVQSETFEEGLPRNCTHVTAHLYASAGASVTARIGIDKKILFWDVKATFWEKTWEKEYVLWNAKNSPVKIALHYEDDNPVSECTRDNAPEEEPGTGNGGGTGGGKKYKYYTPIDSKYAYSGANTGKDSEGNTYTIFDYSLNDKDQATITSYRGNVSVLTIPSTLDGYPVVGIGDMVFKNNSKLYSVMIPDGVVKIGAGAFGNCTNLSSISLSDSLLEMGAHSFYNCDSLTNIEIPKNLKNTYDAYINEFAYDYQYGPFYGCDGLKNVTFQEGITKIPQGLFANCSGIEKIEIPDTVTLIGDSAFYRCVNLQEILIADTVTSIGRTAFNGCTKLSDVQLPKSLENLGFLAFGDCDSLHSIEIPKQLSSVGVESIWLGGGPNYRDGGPFTYCDNLKNVTLEVGTEKVVANLFTWCSGLESIIIPNTVTRINNSAFKNCFNLKSVTIPNSVTAIYENVFENCSSLETIQLPQNLIYIGNCAFAECDGLSSVTIPKTVTKVIDNSYTGNGVFKGCSNLREVVFEKGRTNIPYVLIKNCYGLESVVIPEGVTEIESCAFENCTKLSRVVLPESLQIIGDSSFKNCSTLTEISIPNTVEELGYSAFEACSSLKEILIPDSVSSMGSYVFTNCQSLEKVVLSKSITSIEYQAFANCYKLTAIEIPPAIKTIGKYAFRGTGLNEIVLGENVQIIDECAFYGCTSLKKVTLGNNVKTLGNSVFRNCDALSEIIIPDSITAMGTYTFAECDSLKDVEIGTGITVIPSYMFNQCPELEIIVLPYGISKINTGAFTNCVKLKEITIPRKTETIASNVCSYPSQLTVYGVEGTYAETWAVEIGATFVNKEIKATEVELNATEVTINNGSTTTLIMSVTPADFTDEVVWKSSDTSVATISDTGVVTAKNVGVTTIRVSVGNKNASCQVTVVQPVTSISLNKTSLSLDGGSTYQLTASVYPSNANNKEITWSSSDETIATVSDSGLVTALKKGSATITVAAQDGSGVTKTCNVTVKSNVYIVNTIDEMQSSHPYENDCTDSWVYRISGAEALEVTFSDSTEVEEDFDFIYLFDAANQQVGEYTGRELAGQKISVDGDTVRVQLVSDNATNAYGFAVTAINVKGKTVALKGISLDKERVELAVGESERLTVTYDPVDATVTSATQWSSDNEEVATVDNGVITAVENGTATITANVDGKKASCVVIVKQSIGAIIVSPSDVALRVGEKVRLTVSILPQGAQPTENVKWDVMDETIVAVYENIGENQAEIEGLSAGETQIWVSVDGKETVCSVNVSSSTITLNYQDGSADGSIEAVVGEPIANLPIGLEREGYTFAGWYTQPEGKGELVTAETILTNQWTLYAYWILDQEGMWVAPIGEQRYTGKAIKPEIDVYDGNKLLVKGQDYTVSYKNNTNVADENSTKKPTVVVKGKGQYNGTATVYFSILPKSIEDLDVVAESVYKTVTNKQQKLSPVVKWDKKTLKKGKDYVLSYPETQTGAYQVAGEYEIVITGTGNYTGTRSVRQVLSDKQIVLMNKVSVKKISDVTWTGKQICLEPIVTYKGTLLNKGTDYELEYVNNTEIGTATIKIVGKGMYSGVKKVTFKIKGLSISKAKVYNLQPVTYAAKEWEQNPTLTLGDEVLTENVDYTVSYNKNYNAGTAQIIFTGIGRCSGTLKKSFKINKYDFSQHSVEEEDIVVSYCKGGAKPIVTLNINNEELVIGRDYKLSYKNNSSVSTEANKSKQPTIVIKGMGNYKGTIYKDFVILSKDLSEVKIETQDVVFSTKKNKWVSKPVLTDLDGKKLASKKDYSGDLIYTYVEDAVMQDGSTRTAGTVVDKEDIPVVGTKIRITVTGMKNYYGQAAVEYMIVPASVSKASVKIPNQIYTGKEITLDEKDIQVRISNKLLTTDEFEIVPNSYVNNINKGTASVMIRGKGNYGGTKVVKFKIVPKGIVWR